MAGLRGGPAPLTLALTGDSMITRRMARDADPPTRALFDIIHAADVAFTNVEVVANGFRGHPSSQNGGSHIAAEPFVLDELLAAGFNLFAAGNNHSLDYGIAGLLATMKEMDRRGMTYAGIGHTLDAARLPVYMDSGSGSVGLVACCATLAPGQEAGLQRPDMQGRPGVTPLHIDTVHEVTPAQLVCLRAIAIELGVTRELEQSIQLGFSFPPEPGELSFLGARFRAASQAALRSAPRSDDLAAMARSVRDARARADVVLFSLHVHDQPDDPEQPADHVQSFARQMIEAGADLVTVHGPHLLRGMELYHERPIFYSLGNFFAQNELVARLPADSYHKFRVAQDRSAAELYHLRSDGDRRGFGAERRYWEAVLPVCRFADGRLESITVHPVCLRFGENIHRRGRPRLAIGDTATSVLERFARLSAKFDVRMEVGHGRAELSLARLSPPPMLPTRSA